MNTLIRLFDSFRRRWHGAPRILVIVEHGEVQYVMTNWPCADIRVVDFDWQAYDAKYVKQIHKGMNAYVKDTITNDPAPMFNDLWQQTTPVAPMIAPTALTPRQKQGGLTS